MSWVKDNSVSFFQLFCIKVVKTGRIPQHVAFIMDGNRRYAKKNSVDSSAGHYKGFDKLSETLKSMGVNSIADKCETGEVISPKLFTTAMEDAFKLLEWTGFGINLNGEYITHLRFADDIIVMTESLQELSTMLIDLNRVSQQWCLDLGVPEVTVYAFSIENFKRSKEEVDALMNLARDKFQRLLEEIDQINEWGVRIHVAGRLSLLPEDLKGLVSKAMLATRFNNKLRLNIAYAYTGRDEISRAASHIVDGVKNNEIAPQDIDEELVSQTLELGEAELLVRTSGEVRLSDFMLWQASNTVLYFTDVLWPEFTIWNLLVAIIHFQRNAPSPKPKTRISDTKQQFLEKLEAQRWQQMEKKLLV